MALQRRDSDQMKSAACARVHASQNRRRRHAHRTELRAFVCVSLKTNWCPSFLVSPRDANFAFGETLAGGGSQLPSPHPPKLIAFIAGAHVLITTHIADV